jgi:type VI secretion system Hcp family effector
MKKAFFAFVAVMSLAVPRAFAANSTFMLVPGIPGESVDAHHANWIDVVGLTQTLTEGTRPSAGPQCSIEVRKHLDVAGPSLWLAAVTGQTFDQVQIELVGSTGQRFYQILLNKAVVASISTTDDNTTPAERITFSIGSVTLTYWRQKADGSLDAPVSQTFGC